MTTKDDPTLGTLYLRNFPRALSRQLKALAAQAGMGVGEYAIAKLGEAVRFEQAQATPKVEHEA